MRYCKLQIACFIIVWYVIFIYIQDRKQYKDDSKDYFFKLLVKSGIISIFFDGITAYTVNRFYVVPLWLNNILHMCFLLSLDTFVFVMFRYLMEVTECVPRKKRDRIIYLLPFADALSSSRCYKEPMPLKQCFEIIKNDAGQEFDPFLVEIFLQNRRQIEKICEENNSKKEYFL